MTTAPEKIQVIGTPVPRNDGVAKTTGAAKYTAEIALPGTLWCKTLRSPLPYARIVRIDTSRARALTGVHAVITGDDLPPGVRHGRGITDIPVLAQGVVRFVGEQVAAVAADDEDIALEAVGLIDVEYEELTPVFGAEEALKPGAPLLHPDIQSYGNLPQPIDAPTNEYASQQWAKGDVEEGFAKAEVVVENVFTTQVQHQGYLEPHCCVVSVNADGTVDAWAPNKSPHGAKRELAKTVGLDAQQVVFHPITIGGDFGGKGSAMNMPICYYLSQATGRPVQSLFDYSEDLIAGNPRHPCVIRMRTGAKRDGTLVAQDVELFYNSGAYGGFKPRGPLGGASGSASTYRIENSRVMAHFVYTNNVPCGFMRGPGEPQAMFALESQMDCVADALGIDRVQLRLQNIVREDEEDGLGRAYKEVHSVDTLECAVEVSAFRAPKPSDGRVRVGRGLAIGQRVQAGGETHASVLLNPDGTVTAYTSVFEQGSGSNTVMQQIVADSLGLPADAVEVRVWDTSEVSFDSGIGGSRVTRMASQAVHSAVEDSKAELFKLAAELMNWPEEQLDVNGDLLLRLDTGERQRWADIVSRIGEPVVGKGDVNDNAHNPVTSFTAQVAEVSVDTETGQVKLLKMTSVHDTGRILNPIGHDGQINGGLMQGIGYGLTEEARVEDGRVVTPSFAEYKLPNIADVPELVSVALEKNSGVGPYKIKGIGENSTSQTAPAIANAVADAVGVRIRDLPVTAEKVYAALQARDQ